MDIYRPTDSKDVSALQQIIFGGCLRNISFCWPTRICTNVEEETQN